MTNARPGAGHPAFRRRNRHGTTSSHAQGLGHTRIPQLLVIGPYRMGYEITPRAQSSQLRVFIDYALPDGPVSYWLGRLFGNFYVRWCTQRMANDAAPHFQKRG